MTGVRVLPPEPPIQRKTPGHGPGGFCLKYHGVQSVVTEGIRPADPQLLGPSGSRPRPSRMSSGSGVR
jgi:hypothetical protein